MIAKDWPERMWIEDAKGFYYCAPLAMEGGVEYIRADLAALNESAAGQVSGLAESGAVDYHAPQREQIPALSADLIVDGYEVNAYCDNCELEMPFDLRGMEIICRGCSSILITFAPCESKLTGDQIREYLKHKSDRRAAPSAAHAAPAEQELTVSKEKLCDWWTALHSEDGEEWKRVRKELGEVAANYRREGHSALRVSDGKLEKFDPHPAASPNPQARWVPVSEGVMIDEPAMACPCGHNFVELFPANTKETAWWIGCKPCSRRDPIGPGNHIKVKGTRSDAVREWNRTKASPDAAQDGDAGNMGEM